VYGTGEVDPLRQRLSEEEAAAKAHEESGSSSDTEEPRHDVWRTVEILKTFHGLEVTPQEQTLLAATHAALPEFASHVPSGAMLLQRLSQEPVMTSDESLQAHIRMWGDQFEEKLAKAESVYQRLPPTVRARLEERRLQWHPAFANWLVGLAERAEQAERAESGEERPEDPESLPPWLQQQKDRYERSRRT
jgi:hypothetical protein